MELIITLRKEKGKMKFYEVVIYLQGIKEYHTFELCFQNNMELNNYLRSIGINKSEIVSIKEIGGK